ncbi:MAG: T9SS type A sorting domain-containing protein [Ignavibacteriales bacterium]|nr:T9SS type A sorting domain-containing protein [Ignavibacteriales bacterium]
MLTLRDSMQLPQASIWGGISFNGESISITTTAIVNGKPQLFLRTLNPQTLLQILPPVQLTFESDPQSQRWITDHKHLFLTGQHFIVFSVRGDSDIYIFKTDVNGKRIGSITPIAEHTTNRTNDMMFATDGENIFVAYFKPTDQSIVHTINQQLQPVSAPIITSSQLPHNNLGGLFYRNNSFFMFTGDKAGPNSQLIVTIWNHDWSPAIQQRKILAIPPVGEGYFFASGIAFDSLSKRWIIAFHHVQNSNPDSSTHVDFGIFDESFSLIEQSHGFRGYRPHLLLRNSELYVVYDAGGVFLRRYTLQPAVRKTIAWKQYLTLAPNEGTAFVVDTSMIVNYGGVPVITFANDSSLILSSSGNTQLQFYLIKNNGQTLISLPTTPRGPDGGCIYLPDGQSRFVTEEPASNNTPQKHRSRVISWISSDGKIWTKESGIRYQPGLEDDSIASVVCPIQVKDSVWRMYYVGDFYRTNGVRTAITYDWGWTWKAESRKNIMKNGDVDPHPVYVSDGRIRLYVRTGFSETNPAKRGIGYNDSNDGITFDTTKTTMILPDNTLPLTMNLDPSVIRFTDGTVACFFGAAPAMNQNQNTIPQLRVAYARKPTDVETYLSGIPESFDLSQNYPNPFNPATVINYALPVFSATKLAIYDMLGREVAVLVNQEKPAGRYEATWDASRFSSGVYFYKLSAGSYVSAKKLVLLR